MRVDSRAIFVCCIALLLTHDAHCRDLMERLRARDEAIQSAEFHFEYGSILTPEETDGSYSWSPDKPPNEVRLTVSGDEWILRWPGHANVSSHTVSQDVSFVPNEHKRDGDASAMLALDAPLETVRENMKSDPKFRIVMAGRFPWPEMLPYVSRESGRIVDLGARGVGPQEVHGYELEIPRGDYKYLNSVHPDVVRSPTILLRFYVREKFGDVIDQVDFCLPDGTVTTRFASAGFRQIARGIWFPSEYRLIRYPSKPGENLYVRQFLVKSVTQVNVPLPPETFDVRVPADTIVYDDRKQGTVKFLTSSETDLDKVEKLVADKRASGGPVRKRWKLGRFLLFVNICIAIGLAGFTLMRARRGK